MARTMGVLGNLCTQDFLPAFQQMAAVVATDAILSCTYDIPDPPNGTIDYGRVNVEFQPSANSPGELIPHVPGGLADCGPQGGWYYVPPQVPTQVVFCPATCQIVQASTDGKVTVKFGCTTVVVE